MSNQTGLPKSVIATLAVIVVMNVCMLGYMKPLLAAAPAFASKQMFVSYSAAAPDGSRGGWVVIDDVEEVGKAADVEALGHRVDKAKDWPAGTAVIVSFRRLERQ